MELCTSGQGARGAGEASAAGLYSSALLCDLLDAPTALATCCGFDLCHKYILYLYLYFFTGARDRAWVGAVLRTYTRAARECRYYSFTYLSRAATLRCNNDLTQSPLSCYFASPATSGATRHPPAWSPTREYICMAHTDYPLSRLSSAEIRKRPSGAPAELPRAHRQANRPRPRGTTPRTQTRQPYSSSSARQAREMRHTPQELGTAQMHNQRCAHDSARPSPTGPPHTHTHKHIHTHTHSVTQTHTQTHTQPKPRSTRDAHHS